jgi:hypothetical protein
MCSPVNTRMSPEMTPETTLPMSPATAGNPQNVNVTSQSFASELQSFFVLCLMNLVFGSLAMAIGMQFIVTAVLAMTEGGTFGWFPVFQVLLGWAAAVVGLRWILSSAKILKGVTKIRREYRAMEGAGAGAIQKGPVSGETSGEATSGETRVEPLSGVIREEAVSSGGGKGPVSAEMLTGVIVRMMAHYRENWKAIWRMNLISTLGGCIFLVLGVLNLVQAISAWLSAAGIVSLLLSFIAAAINLTIGLVSLLFSSWFRRYARAWDHRLIEASHSEEALKNAMEQG